MQEALDDRYKMVWAVQSGFKLWSLRLGSLVLNLKLGVLDSEVKKRNLSLRLDAAVVSCPESDRLGAVE